VRIGSYHWSKGGGDSPDRRSIWAFQLRKFDFRKFFGRKGKQRQVWVAGGIGITPFLAWVQSLSEHEAVRIYLFYSALNAEEALGLEVLEKAKARLHGFSFDVVFSQSEGRVDANRLIASAPST
jgi:predicted ferric reductase